MCIRDRANKAMMKILFSDKNLNSSMDVGFKGNPNIGSVVLNQISKCRLACVDRQMETTGRYCSV